MVKHVITCHLSLTRLSVLRDCLVFSSGHIFLYYSNSVSFFPVLSSTISTLVVQRKLHSSPLAFGLLFCYLVKVLLLLPIYCIL